MRALVKTEIQPSFTKRCIRHVSAWRKEHLSYFSSQCNICPCIVLGVMMKTSNFFLRFRKTDSLAGPQLASATYLCAAEESTLSG